MLYVLSRGRFDERPVAVKRLLPECFAFADREVRACMHACVRVQHKQLCMHSFVLSGGSAEAVR